MAVCAPQSDWEESEEEEQKPAAATEPPKKKKLSVKQKIAEKEAQRAAKAAAKAARKNPLTDAQKQLALVAAYGSFAVSALAVFGGLLLLVIH